jgi:hypothetical protein
VDGSLLLDETTLRILRVGLCSLLADVYTLYNSTLLRSIYREYLTLCATAIASIDVNHVPFLNMQFRHISIVL